MVISEYMRTYLKEYYAKPHIQKARRAYAKIHHAKTREKLMTILGSRCSNPECAVLGGCTDIRCLQIDHVNGGGKKEIRRFNATNNMYVYYTQNPEEAKRNLQILCANCNWIKRWENNEHGGISITEEVL